MSNRILFCNIGWMEKYEGVTEFDEILNGGKYVKTNKDGGEIYCFINRNGYCYGYVQPVNQTASVTGGTIKIEKLGASKDANLITGVDVVLTATRPYTGGTFIVGWYKNATVYRYKQDCTFLQKSGHLDVQGNQYGYRFYADYNQVKLLLPDQRTFKIPRATGQSPIKGGMGQSNVWYAQDLDDEQFFISVRNLMDGGDLISWNKSTRSKPDIEKNKLVEAIAVDLTAKYFRDYGYNVNSVEKDNRGWDLEATAENITLRVEVKGLSGKVVNIELTPNEYKAFIDKDNRFIYRLFIVTECITKSPKLNIFAFNLPTEKWLNEDGECLKIQLKTAASLSLS